MRCNIYAEEQTDRIEIISKEIEGRKFTGLRFYLELPVTVPNGGGIGYKEYSGPFLHGAADIHTVGPHTFDDDSSAVTFWGKQDLRTMLRKALAMLDKHYAAREHDSGPATREGEGPPRGGGEHDPDTFCG